MRASAVLLGVVMVGCGGSSTERFDVGAYRATATDIVAAAEFHDSTMGSVSTAEQCQAEMTRYQAVIQPMIEQMEGMSGDMDACMSSGGMTNPDARSSCQSMMSELQGHLAQGCGSGDPAAMQAEADRHLHAMAAIAEHEQALATTMEGMMGGGMMGTGGMMQGGYCGGR